MKLILALTLAAVHAAQTCPYFICNGNDAMNSTGMCFAHGGSDPVKSIQVQYCEQTNEDQKAMTCPFNMENMAWVNSN